jgi:DNA topoisomerase I
MVENLVIVESPAKASTIEKFLGKGYLVKSSFGHIRDLEKKDLGIDIHKEYQPSYIVPEDKKKVVAELKKLAKEAKTIWLASDEDREGEAISWHLFEVLELKESNTRRIVFNEITKDAILHAIKNPRSIDNNLVNAQQARRVLDRLVGFEISPILWKKVRPALSAGRVQSVAVRLIVEREREINAFKSTSSFKINANFFANEKKAMLLAELSEKIVKKEDTISFLNKCKSANYKVADVITKPSKKSPAPPFTTSTLQQEASRKLSFSVAQTMAIAQRLYEAGKITYMRTDSVNLSETALDMTQKVIEKMFGSKYAYPRKYKTKSKGAQEAHEAIRPTYMDQPEIDSNSQENRLYELIWKRTIASQMSDAQLEKTTITIDISTTPEKFLVSGEVLKFDGFLKVYIESTDEESEENNDKLLPPIQVGQMLDLDYIKATERYTHYPPRYTEASLVKKLEELGIGRPSTYAPTISTIQQRGYIVKEDREGKERQYVEITLKSNNLNERMLKELTGAEKSKLFPSDIGIIVNDFLVLHFNDILDYNFTANVEKEFDEIALGEMKWTKMIDKFYKPFHTKVDETTKNSDRSVGERVLGTDPASGKPVIVKIGRYGPMAQIGGVSDEEKPKFAGLLKGQSIETIQLSEALDLFKLPRVIGNFENKEMVVGVGRFGPYIRHDSKFYSLKPGEDSPLTIGTDRAIQIIQAKRIELQNKIILEFPEDKELKVLNGRWGAYIAHQGNNYKIPKTKTANMLSFKECMEIISAGPKTGAKAKGKGKSGSKSVAATKAKSTAKTKSTPKAKSTAKPKVTTKTKAKTAGKKKA